MACSSLAFCFIYFCFAIIPAYFDDRKRQMRSHNKLIADLAPGNDAGNLTIEFENNRSQLGKGALNDSKNSTQR